MLARRQPKGAQGAAGVNEQAPGLPPPAQPDLPPEDESSRRTPRYLFMNRDEREAPPDRDDLAVGGVFLDDPRRKGYSIPRGTGDQQGTRGRGSSTANRRRTPHERRQEQDHLGQHDERFGLSLRGRVDD